MAEIELQAVAGAEPIICPGLPALAFAANPTAQQISIVGVAFLESEIEVIEATAQRAVRGNVGVNAFHAQIEFWNFWQMRKVQSRADSGAIPISNGRELVVGKRVAVEGHPIAQTRQAIRPIEARATVAGILWTAIHCRIPAGSFRKCRE